MNIEALQNTSIHAQQRVTFVSILYLMIIAGIVFVSINFHKGNHVVAVVELIIMSVGVIFLYVLKKIDNIESFLKLALTFLVIFYSVMLFILSRPNTSENVYVWMFLSPYLSYLLLGRKAGLFITLIVGILAITITYQVKLDSKSFIPLFNLISSMSIIWFLAHTYELSNEKAREKLTQLSLQDNLTQLYNRKVLPMIVEKHKQDAQLSFAILDIDYFKKINDNYGHECGDKALIFLAEEMNSFFKSMAYIVRMGGEEFCVIAPNMDSREMTRQVEKFLEVLSSKDIEYQTDKFNLTFSAGVSSLPDDGREINGLIKVADERLYKAKREGRNRVISKSELI